MKSGFITIIECMIVVAIIGEEKEVIKHINFYKNIKFISSNSSNFSNLIQKCEKIGININSIVCGEDRKESYEKQLEDFHNINLDCFDRKDGISATLVEKFIKEDNFEEYCKYVPEFSQNKSWFEYYKDIL